MTDYEIINAMQWDLNYQERQQQTPSSNAWQVVNPQLVAESSRRRDPPRNLPGRPRQWNDGGRRTDRRERQPTRLIEHTDNDAEGLWRSNQPAGDHVKIPDDLILKDKNDTSANIHETIATQHGTYIYSEQARGSGGSRTFGIWGDKGAVAATKRAIADWIEESGFSKKSARSAKFAKIVSLTPKLRERAERGWEREVRRQRFRRHPPPGMVFGAIGNFHWPVKEYRPEEILGNNFEAFDPIRMGASCYVVYKKPMNLFRVMGKPSEVKDGLQRIRQTCFQIAARQLNPVRLYLLHWPKPDQVPLTVYMAEYDPPALMSVVAAGDEDAARLRKSPLGDDLGEHDRTPEEAEKQSQASKERLRNAIFKTLARLHYYRGHVKMRVRSGTFLAVQYMEHTSGVYDLDEYEMMLQMSQFCGEVTKEIGNKATEDSLLSALQETTDLITPSTATAHDLKSVKPVYTVAFTFRELGGGYCLTVDWHEAFDESTEIMHFEAVSKKWTRLERDTNALTPLLDVSLCDLSDSSAWQFDIVASPQVIDESKLSPQLLSFSRNLKIDPDAVQKAKRNDVFVRFNPFANLTSFQQRISYQYMIVNSDFTLELSRFQDRTMPVRSSTSMGNGSTTPTVTEPRWSVQVYRQQWDTMFSTNERLPVGEQAGWQHDAPTWFPHDVGPGSVEHDEDDQYQGWNQMLDKLKRIEELVRGVKSNNEGEDEDLLGGMTVG